VQKLDLTIFKGKTFSQIIRWETEPFVYVPITSITQAAPARVTAPNHGLPTGWRVIAVSVLGMSEINCTNTPPKSKDWRRATVIDPSTIELNEVNAAQFTKYQSGGYLQFYTPMSLAGCTATLTVYDQYGGAVLLTLSNALGSILLDDTSKTIKLLMNAAATAGITWDSGVYDLQVTDSVGVVYGLAYGGVSLDIE
jgi:hypothetical protein